MRGLKVINLVFAAILFSVSAIAQEVNSNLVAAVAPTYPQLAYMTRTEGRIKLEISVNGFGAVSTAKDYDNDRNLYKLFGKASESAAKKWQFSTDLNNAERKYVITFVYRIMGKDATDENLATIFYPPLTIEVRQRSYEPVYEEPSAIDVK
jgi:hypothetical protein